jgi:hypothetical protein
MGVMHFSRSLKPNLIDDRINKHRPPSARMPEKLLSYLDLKAMGAVR